MRKLLVHVADLCMADGTTPGIDTPALDLIGSTHGARWYTRTSGLFAMDRRSWSEWVAKGGR